VEPDPAAFSSDLNHLVLCWLRSSGWTVRIITQSPATARSRETWVCSYQSLTLLLGGWRVRGSRLIRWVRSWRSRSSLWQRWETLAEARETCSDPGDDLDPSLMYRLEPCRLLLGILVWDGADEVVALAVLVYLARVPLGDDLAHQHLGQCAPINSR